MGTLASHLLASNLDLNLQNSSHDRSYEVTDAKDSLWHKDVMLYRLVKYKNTVGYIFLDPYSSSAAASN